MFAEMHQDFQREQVGSRDDVPRAAIAEAADQMLDAVQVQFKSFSRCQTRGREDFGKLRDLGAKISRPHDHVRPQQLLIVIDNDSWKFGAPGVGFIPSSGQPANPVVWRFNFVRIPGTMLLDFFQHASLLAEQLLGFIVFARGSFAVGEFEAMIGPQQLDAGHRPLDCRHEGQRFPAVRSHQQFALRAIGLPPQVIVLAAHHEDDWIVAAAGTDGMDEVERAGWQSRRRNQFELVDDQTIEARLAEQGEGFG